MQYLIAGLLGASIYLLARIYYYTTRNVVICETVLVKYFTENHYSIKHGSDRAAGYDLEVVSVEDHPTYVKYNLGVGFSMPNGYFGMMVPRSSAYKRGQILANCAAIIDSDYTGEVSAIFYKENGFIPFGVGDHPVQILFIKHSYARFKDVEVLPESSRGDNGYGSTGK